MFNSPGKVSLFFESSQFRFSTVMKTDRLSILQWNFTQPAGKGGMWLIKDTKSELCFGYNTSKPVASTPILAVKNETLWDIWESHTTPGCFQ